MTFCQRLVFFAVRRTRPQDQRLTFCNGVVLDRQQCARTFGDWLPAIFEFCASLHAMEIDISAFACLCALTLVTGSYLALDCSKLSLLRLIAFAEKQIKLFFFSVGLHCAHKLFAIMQVLKLEIFSDFKYFFLNLLVSL